MGCDIHAYIEYRPKGENRWSDFGGRINPGRNYLMFEAMAGVRGEESKAIVPPRGQPKDLAWASEWDAFLQISEDGKGDHECTLESAKRWHGEIINDSDGKPEKTPHPDWHSHSWLSAAELGSAIDNAYSDHCAWLKEEGERQRDYWNKSPGALNSTQSERLKRIYDIPERTSFQPEYQAIHAAMLRFEQCGCEARLVFWFDN